MRRIRLAGVGVLLAVAACANAPQPGSGMSTSTGLPSSHPVTTAPATPTAAGTLPRFDHAVVAVFENKDIDQVLGSGQAPFIDQLARAGVAFTNAHAIAHPSQPNYLALFSGSTQGVTNDACLQGVNAPNLAAQLADAGRSFVGYAEDLPTPGFTGCRSGDYAQKHAVWAAFTNVPPGINQPWSAWPGAFENLPSVAFVIPNLCHDMHDCDVATGDQWLQANLSGYLDWARTHNSLLVVTFDESDSQRGSNHIITLFDGATLRPGRYDEPIDHYRLLRTIEEIYHLPALGEAASTTPITDVWASAAPH